MRFRSLIGPVAAAMFLLATGCEGDDGTSKLSPNASDFSGTWSGTYSLSGEQGATGVSFELANLTGWDETGQVAGTLESDFVSGAFAGLVDDAGTVVGEVDNEVDGKLWTAILTMTDDGLSLELTDDLSTAFGDALEGPPANGINYKTTITNQTDERMPVLLYTYRFSLHKEEYVWIEPGQSYTYETGAWCPIGFKGEAWGDSPGMAHTYFYDTDCRGAQSSRSKWLWVCCRSGQFAIQLNYPDAEDLCQPPLCKWDLNKL